MKNFNTLLAALILLFALQANAQQISLMANDMTVEPGDNFEIDVNVMDFDAIASVQFAMFWDPAVIEFVGVGSLGLPDMTASGNFFENDTVPGAIRFSWYDFDPYLSGVTLDDNSTIFSLEFKAIGGPAQTSTFVIDSDPVWPPLPIEVTNAAGDIQAVNIFNATITMAGVSASYETMTSEFVLFQNSPNPFAETTNIVFELNRKSNTQLSIYDHAGKVVFEQSKTYTSGSHTILIDRNLFQSAGSYFYTLTTENATATRQLVVR